MPAWRRTFWAVWVANVATAVGMMSFLPFFPSYLGELGVEDPRAVKVWTGAVFGAAPLVAAFMSPVWGALGDRLGRKLMVLRALSGIALFVGAMGLVSSPAQLLVLRVFQGAFSGFVPPSITLVSVVAPAERQGQVAARLQMALGVGAVMGPALGGILAAHFSHRAVFGVVAVLAVSALLVVALFAHEDAGSRRAPEPGASSSPLAVLRASLGDLGELVRHPALRRTVLLLFWIQFGSGATRPQLELFVGSLGGGPSATAWLFACFAGVNILTMPLWGRLGDRWGHGRVLLLCGWLCSLGLLLHAFAWSLPSLFAVHLAFGVAWAGSGPSAFGVAALETSPDQRGGAMGAVFSARALAVSLSAVLGGFLAALVGLRGLFLLSAVSLALALGWGLLRGAFSSGADRR